MMHFVVLKMTSRSFCQVAAEELYSSIDSNGVSLEIVLRTSKPFYIIDRVGKNINVQPWFSKLRTEFFLNNGKGQCRLSRNCM